MTTTSNNLYTAPGSYPSPMSPTSVVAYATTVTNAANNYIVQLGQLASSLSAPTIVPDFPTGGSAPTLVQSTTPEMSPVLWESPSVPNAFTGSITIDDLMPAAFDEAPPQLLFGTAPDPFSDNVPDAPGVSLTFEYPDLAVTLPGPPSLLSLAVMPFSGVNMPTIDENVPTLSLVAPSVREYTPGQQYTSALLTAASQSLQDRIQNGGTGLSPAVEQAIWDRGREREYRQAADALAELERMEVLGYAFPPGTYIDSRIKIQTELGYASFGYSREVAIEQAKLEQSNVLAALEQSTQLESTLINYNNAVEQRLFESTKYATEAGISIYNAQVQAYTAYLDAYKTKVAIYEAKVRGEMAKVETYKTQIAAEQAKAEINTALVNQYRVQSEVALSAIDVYKAQIAGIQAKAEIEKLKIDIFGEQVRAYGAKVNAYTAGVEAFRARIQGETAKQEAYRTSVSAYQAHVDAASKQVDARISEYRAKLEAKVQEWEGYKNAYQSQASRAQAIAASNNSLAEAFRSQVTAVSSYNEVLTKQWQVALEQSQRTAEIGINAAKMNSDLYLSTRSVAMDAAKLGAQVNAQLGAAAINSTNYSASWSYGSSQSYSNGYSFSDVNSLSSSTSTSFSTNTNTNQNYNTNASA